jgi:hypothetical protein
MWAGVFITKALRIICFFSAILITLPLLCYAGRQNKVESSRAKDKKKGNEGYVGAISDSSSRFIWRSEYNWRSGAIIPAKHAINSISETSMAHAILNHDTLSAGRAFTPLSPATA